MSGDVASNEPTSPSTSEAQHVANADLKLRKKRRSNKDSADHTTAKPEKSKKIDVISGGDVQDNMGMDPSDLLTMPVDLLYMPKNCAEQMEHFAKYVWDKGWRAMPHHALPSWLRDNEYLRSGHRPPLPSTKACLESLFRLHTETGNIWTHLIGAIFFLISMVVFMVAPHIKVDLKEKLIFLAYFLGAICCLMFSTLFHTFYCYSPSVSRMFSKLDYAGIAILIVGSYVPWLYYAFYCSASTIITYLSMISIMAAICIGCSLWDKFSEPRFRVARAGIFAGLGGCGIIPGVHYFLMFGSHKAFTVGGMEWFLLTASLYLIGAALYAARIPERIFPGKFDIWFQSHQIFHVFVVAAAYAHYHGICKLASYRLTIGDCLSAHTESDFSFEF